MVTLTSPAAPDVEERFTPAFLREHVLKIRHAFPRFWRKTPWGMQVRDSNARGKRSRRDTSYICAVEISPSGMVHVHALVYGEFVSQASLQEIWSNTLGETAIVDVRAVRGSKGVGEALREVLKYATKGEKGERVQPVRAAAVELALRDVHRVSLGGAVRHVRITDSAGSAEDATAGDLHDDHQMACQSCGVIGGPWIWRGTVSSERVARNGGFGLFIEVAASTVAAPAGADP
jgi:hypothetical protein